MSRQAVNFANINDLYNPCKLFLKEQIRPFKNINQYIHVKKSRKSGKSRLGGLKFAAISEAGQNTVVVDKTISRTDKWIFAVGNIYNCQI